MYSITAAGANGIVIAQCIVDSSLFLQVCSGDLILTARAPECLRCGTSISRSGRLDEHECMDYLTNPWLLAHQEHARSGAAGHRKPGERPGVKRGCATQRGQFWIRRPPSKGAPTPIEERINSPNTDFGVRNS